MQPGGIINRLIEPELALAFGADNDKLFRNIFTRSCQLSFWGSLVVSIVMVPVAYWLFPLWTSGVVAMNWPTYLILILGVLINGIWYTALMAPYATNRHGRIAVLFALIYGGAAFGVGYAGTISLGLEGAAIAVLIAETTMAMVIVPSSSKVVGMTIFQWLKSTVRPPVHLLGNGGIGFWKRITAMSE